MLVYIECYNRRKQFYMNKLYFLIKNHLQINKYWKSANVIKHKKSLENIQKTKLLLAKL